DRNFWLMSAETGAAAWGRYVETWAPAQVRALADGQGFAVGLTYGPVTSVGSTVGLFRDANDPIAYAYDWPLVGGRGRLRYGGAGAVGGGGLRAAGLPGRGGGPGRPPTCSPAPGSRSSPRPMPTTAGRSSSTTGVRPGR